MINHPKIFLFVLCFFIFSLANANADSSALAPTDIYVVEVPIATNKVDDRNKAFTEALKKVLVQLTHQQTVISMPLIKNKLNKAEIFVKSYSYSHKANTGQQDLFLVVDFDPKGIEQLLAQAKIQYNPEQQEEDVVTPSDVQASFKQTEENNKYTEVNSLSSDKADILVWLTILGALPKDNIVLNDSSNSDLAANFKSNARQAGLNVLLPVMDLAELSQVTPDDICNLNTEVINKASHKYNGDGIMIGCISRSLTGKKGEWLFLINKKQYAWIFYGVNDDDILKQALVNVSKTLSTNVSNAIKTQQEPVITSAGPVEKIIIKIEGVSSMDQYNNVIKYLQSIAPINNVELLNLNASSVELKVSVSGGKNAFIMALESPEQNKLVPVGDENANILDYRLVEYSQ